MAAIDWPAGLPPRPEQRGLAETLGSGTLRSDIKTGTPQRRNRSNAKPDAVDCSVLLTAEQVGLLDEFYRATTRGCLRFNWVDELGAAAECRFVTAPKIAVADGATYRATFKFEVL